VRAANRVTFYDFDTGDTRGPYDEALAAANVRALFGGLFELLPGGHLMVEETSNGRLLILDRTGRVVAENVNRAKDGKVYFLGWSRYMDRAAGDRARDAARAAGCAT
jgi:hypothetical protein